MEISFIAGRNIEHVHVHHHAWWTTQEFSLVGYVPRHFLTIEAHASQVMENKAPPHFSSPPLLFGLAMLVVQLTGDDLTWINRLFKIWRPESLTAPRHLSLDHCHYPTPTHFSRSLFPPLAPLLHGTQLPVIDSQSLTQSFALFNHLHRLVLWRFRGLMGKLLVCFQQSCRVLGH